MKKLALTILRLTPIAVLALCAFALALTHGCAENPALVYVEEDAGMMVLRRTEGEDPKSLDPHKAGDVLSSRQCGMTYETLLQYDYLKRPATLVPCLAREMPSYDAATLSYTFKLRDDIFFTDDRCFHPAAKGKSWEKEGDEKQSEKGPGRKCTAHDMAYSFKRLAALPDSGGFWVIQGKVEGLDEFQLAAQGLDENAFREQLKKSVSGIQVLDDYTIRFKLTEVYPQFLGAITLSYGAAVAVEAADYYGKELARKPVGTGPFILKEWKHNEKVVWLKNPKFRKELFPQVGTAPEDQIYKRFEGMPLPLVDKVVFRIIKEGQTEYLEFLQGNLDVSGLEKDQFSAAMLNQTEVTPALKAKGIDVLKYEEPSIHYFSFNMNDPIVGAPGGAKALAIRRAVALSVDRDDFIHRYLNDRGSPARQLVPPSVYGNFPECDMSSQVFDPEKGRKILSDAGFKLEASQGSWKALDPATGKQITMTLLLRGNDAESADQAQFWGSCGKKIGVLIEPQLLTFAEFLKRQDEGSGQAYDAGWIMDYPDAQNMLQLLFGPNKPPGVNSAAYASDNFDNLYREMAPLDETVPAEKVRKGELIKKMHKVLDKDVPWVLIDFRIAMSLYNGSWYVPSKPNPFAYTYIKYVYSDSKKRGEMALSWNNPPLLPALIMLSLLIVPAMMMGFRIVKQAR